MTDQGRGDHPYGDGAARPGSSVAGQEGDSPVPGGPSARSTLADVHADEGTGAPGPGRHDSVREETAAAVITAAVLAARGVPAAAAAGC